MRLVSQNLWDSWKIVFCEFYSNFEFVYNIIVPWKLPASAPH